MRASPVFATSKPSPGPPPPPFGVISSRRNFANLAFKSPKCPIVALANEKLVRMFFQFTLNLPYSFVFWPSKKYLKNKTLISSLFQFY